MRNVKLIGLLLVVLLGCNSKDECWVNKAAKIAAYQLEQAGNNYTPLENPRSLNTDGTIRIADPEDWTCGFFPGSLWYMYEITNDAFYAEKARAFTEVLDSVQYMTHTHDLGFMLYCSYGNSYRIEGKVEDRAVLLQGAKSLISRFDPKIGCIRSWDFGEWQFPVIIDNMMNLEYLFWAFKETNDSTFYDIAVSHAETTMENHFRENYSSYHVVSYDTITGGVEMKQTHQGIADESSWARGQAWGLYGYTLMYKETGEKKFLEHAQGIANYIMTHPSMPEDAIPYWDFDLPGIPNEPRDASAAAVIANALIDLYDFVPEEGDKYFSFAEKILKSLSSDDYLSPKNKNAFFILMHSVGDYPENSEIDTSINYADYYFLQALIKYSKKKNIEFERL